VIPADELNRPWYGHLDSLAAAGFALWSRYGAFDGAEQRGNEERPRNSWARVVAQGDLLEAAPGFLDVADGVATMAITGPLMRRRTSLTDWYGIETYDVISARIDALARDGDVDRLLLVGDSPGGHAQGVEEPVAAMDRFRAGGGRIVGWVDGMAASAMYYVMAGADEIFSSETGFSGSIGTILTMYDFFGLFQKLGVEAKVLRTAIHKAPGQLGEQVSEEQLGPLQEIVDDFGQRFFDHVGERRGLSGKGLRAVTDGRVHLADSAMALGLVDGIGTMEEVAAYLTAGGASAHTQSTGGSMLRSKKGAEATADQADPKAAEEAVEARLEALQEAFPDADSKWQREQMKATRGLGPEDAVAKAKVAYCDILEAKVADLESKAEERDARLQALESAAENEDPDGEGDGEEVDDDDDPDAGEAADRARSAAPRSKANRCLAGAHGRAGLKPLTTGTPRGGEPDDAIVAYERRKRELRDEGVAIPTAHIREHEPDLLDAYVAAVNDKKEG